MTDDPQDAAYEKGRRMLPPELRDSWAIVPRYTLYQLFFVGSLFGAGIAFLIATVLPNQESMKWLGCLSVVALFVQGYLVNRYKGDKAAQEFLDKTPPE